VDRVETAGIATPVRSYWKGEGGLIGELAYRLTGSSDLYELSGRLPYASINSSPATTASRSKTWSATNGKHNEANLEENRDGSDDNRNWNCGAEGPTNESRSPGVAGAAEAQFPRDPAPVAGRADAAGG